MPAKTKNRNKEIDIAVVDIGSNSVRLAIYRCTGKKHALIFEKKAVCGLARGLSSKHPKLDRTGITLTLRALRKFRRILKKRAPNKISAIGTAALRAVASSGAGKKFRRQAERALGHNITIISGRKEARLTARGVMSALPKVSGICGDLGGGSLELAEIWRGRVGHTATLALGSLTLITESKNDALKAEKILRERLDRVAWLGKAKDRTFYPIGGSWRAVARVMMRMQGQKIRPIHGFAINAVRAKKYAEIMARKKPRVFHRMHKKIRHRADVIPYAAAALAELINRMHPARIVFSAHGVREGVVREKTG
jgi:exopolyphosphatase/guanosine-5'-triphosphate,3'-diphosphate pyrophosphatase